MYLRLYSKQREEESETRDGKESEGAGNDDENYQDDGGDSSLDSESGSSSDEDEKKSIMKTKKPQKGKEKVKENETETRKAAGHQPSGSASQNVVSLLFPRVSPPLVFFFFFTLDITQFKAVSHYASARSSESQVPKGSIAHQHC